MTGRVPPSEAFGSQNAEREAIQSGLRDAGRFNAAQLIQLFQKMQALFSGLNAQVAAAISANSYTKSEIDTKVANPPSGSAVTGNVSATGTISAAGLATFDAGIRSQNVRNFVVSTNYAGVWADGVSYRLGISPSTRRFKKAIRRWKADPEKFLELVPISYGLTIPERTVAVVDELGYPVFDDDGNPVFTTEPGYEDDPSVRRIGFGAEDLIALGFPQAVVLDPDGSPVSINYAELVVPLQLVTRWLRDQLRAEQAKTAILTRQMQALADHVGFTLPKEDQ